MPGEFDEFLSLSFIAEQDWLQHARPARQVANEHACFRHGPEHFEYLGRFHSLDIRLRYDIVKNFQTDASTAIDPVKWMFICDMESMMANIALNSGDGSKIHTQPDQIEIVIVIEGEAKFRLGEEVYRVGP